MNLIKQHLDVAGAVVAFFMLTWIVNGVGLGQYGIIALVGAAVVYFLLSRYANKPAVGKVVTPPPSVGPKPPVTQPPASPSSSQGSGSDR